jgi:hypothetical protein
VIIPRPRLNFPVRASVKILTLEKIQCGTQGGIIYQAASLDDVPILTKLKGQDAIGECITHLGKMGSKGARIESETDVLNQVNIWFFSGFIVKCSRNKTTSTGCKGSGSFLVAQLPGGSQPLLRGPHPKTERVHRQRGGCEWNKLVRKDGGGRIAFPWSIRMIMS